MTPERLREIEERAAKATAGPWIEHDGQVWSTHPNGTLFQFIADWGHSSDDLRFCAVSRTDVPALLAHISDQAAEIERLTARVLELEDLLGLHPKTDIQSVTTIPYEPNEHLMSARAAIRAAKEQG